MKAFPIVAALAAFAALAPAPAPAATSLVWTRSWEAPPMEMPAPRPPRPGQPAPPGPPPSSDATFRMVARLSAGGTTLRLRLSNEMAAAALPVGAVHVALAGPDGGIIAGSDRAVTFDGDAAPIIPAGAPLVSDPVALRVAPLAHVVVSIHVPGDTTHLTVHPAGTATARIVPGDQTATARLAPGGTTSTMRYVLTGIDVAGGPATGTIVALGDSITDGAQSTNDADRRWPDILAERLNAAGAMRFAVANAGISGNRLLSMGSGPAALARLDRDVLAVPGIRYLVVLEGINDIGGATRSGTTISADEVIDAYRQIITRAHDRGIKVIGATVLPYKGAAYYGAEGDKVRGAVNAWIRAPGHFDGVIDFDRATADRADPLTMARAYDSGDNLHPGDAGYRAMGEAIDLGLFR